MIPSITETDVERVERGAQWMDENHPGWAHSINLDALKMDSCNTCIIGQACREMGFYWKIVEAGAVNEDAEEWAVNRGFDIEDPDFDFDTARLTKESQAKYFGLEVLWTEQVKKRIV